MTTKIWLTASVLLLVAMSRARAQSASPAASGKWISTSAHQPETRQRDQRGHAFIPALIGSATGAFAGWHLGGQIAEATQCCRQSDDPGFGMSAAGAAIFSVAGSVAAVSLFGPDNSAASPWPTAIVGVLPAAGAAALASAATDGNAVAALLSYSLVHAAFISLFKP